MNAMIERWWILSGLLLGIVPVLGLANPNGIDLQALSIFFAALLAVAAIIMTAWESATLRKLRESGHYKRLLEYLIIPTYLCFLLIIMQLGKELVLFPSTMSAGGLIIIFNIVEYGLIGVFIASMFRILLLLAPIMGKYEE